MAVSMFTYTTIETYHDWLGVNPDGCEQAVRHYLDEIRRQEQLNAFLEVYSDEALARARELDERRNAGNQPGRLHGVVIALNSAAAWSSNPWVA